MPESIPGAFFVDTPVPPKLDLSGAQSQLFQLPQTPSASSSLYRSISTSRKRARYDPSQNHRHDMTSSEREKPTLYDSFTFDDGASPTPLVNTEYRLAGGREQPRNPFESGVGEPSTELDFRPSRYHQLGSSATTHHPIDDSVESLSSPAGTTTAGGNSRKRSRRDSVVGEDAGSASVGWGRTVINVVGKVLDFCWTGAFRGFYAGGGRGYDLSSGTSPHRDGHQTGDGHWESTVSPTEKETTGFATSTGCGGNHEFRLFPGHFPDDEIQRNWVVVEDGGSGSGGLNEPGSSTPSMRRVAHRKTMGSTYVRRRPIAVPRPGKRVTTGWSSPARPATPNRSQASSPTKSKDSPASVEAQRFAAQRRRIERQEDASLRRLNRQLQAMIQEGKAALGSRVEIDEVDEADEV